MQSGVPNYFEKKRRFTYKRIAVYDASTTNLQSYAPEIVAFISKGLNYGSVFVHCQRGVSRSSTAVVFYLMNAAGMGFSDALQLCKSRRDCINPIPAFIAQLKEYELECREKGLIQCDKHEVKKKAATGTINSDKKRKAIGPCRGPAPRPRVLGPSLPPASNANDPDEDASKKEGYKEGSKAKKQRREEICIGPSIPTNSGSPSIGSSLPPQEKVAK
jgi:hypothetical protein